MSIVKTHQIVSKLADIVENESMMSNTLNAFYSVNLRENNIILQGSSRDVLTFALAAERISKTNDAIKFIGKNWDGMYPECVVEVDGVRIEIVKA